MRQGEGLRRDRTRLRARPEQTEQRHAPHRPAHEHRGAELQCRQADDGRWGDEDEDGFLDKDDPNPGQINGKAIIRRQPVGTTVVPGAAVQLKVIADGVGLSYQWKRGTTNVGGDSPVLDLATTSITDGGIYKVVITNGSQQLLYLFSEVLCDPGDIGLVEDPTYFV